VFDGQKKQPNEIEERVFVRGAALDGRVLLGVGLESVGSLDVLL
jgi:hypothetical protein